MRRGPPATDAKAQLADALHQAESGDAAVRGRGDAAAQRADLRALRRQARRRDDDAGVRRPGADLRRLRPRARPRAGRVARLKGARNSRIQDLVSGFKMLS